MIDESNISKHINIMEVGPRDGLQNEKRFIDTEDKIAFIEELADTGLKRIETTAFVSPKWIPALGDHFEVVKRIKRVKGVKYAALVPNVYGYERATSAGIDEISIVVSVSTTHNKKNLNGSTLEVLERYKEVTNLANADKIPFRAYVSCAFGCPYEGFTSYKESIFLIKKLLDLGAYEISIGDTIGVASPFDVIEFCKSMHNDIDFQKIALHMHDTRGTALACIFAGMLCGIRSFDSSVGGLGGCPYAKGAAGNVATEDLIYMLKKMGIDCNIDLEKLSQVSLKMEKRLYKKLPSKIIRTFEKVE